MNDLKQNFTISFFGHRTIEDWGIIEEKLEKIICSIIESRDNVIFLVGRDGDFDYITASVIRRIKRRTERYDLILVWVMPYPKVDFIRMPDSFSMYYDEIEICAKSSAAHPKAAFTIRNHEMVERSDLVICYSKRNSGGTYQAFSYAKTQNKLLINIAEETQYAD